MVMINLIIKIYKTAATYELTKLLLTGGRYGIRKTLATRDEKSKIIATLELIKKNSNPCVLQYITNQANTSSNQSHVTQCK